MLVLHKVTYSAAPVSTMDEPSENLISAITHNAPPITCRSSCGHEDQQVARFSLPNHPALPLVPVFTDVCFRASRSACRGISSTTSSVPPPPFYFRQDAVSPSILSIHALISAAKLMNTHEPGTLGWGPRPPGAFCPASPDASQEPDFLGMKINKSPRFSLPNHPDPPGSCVH